MDGRVCAHLLLGVGRFLGCIRACCLGATYAWRRTVVCQCSHGHRQLPKGLYACNSLCLLYEGDIRRRDREGATGIGGRLEDELRYMIDDEESRVYI